MKRAARLWCAALVFLLAAGLCPAVRAQNGVVRVAVFDEPHFAQVSGGGAWSGYMADYFSAVAREAGWAVEVIPCASYAEAAALLRARRADLLGPVFSLDSPQEDLMPSRLSMARTSACLLASAESQLAYEDFAAFDGLRTGVVSQSVRSAAFLSYAKEKGFAPVLVQYANDSAMLEALQMGQIDVAVAVASRCGAREKVVARFEPEEARLAVLADNTALAQTLDEAMARLAAERPALEAQLTARHFPDLHAPVFSQEELAFARALGTLRVGLPLDGGPMASLNAAGEVEGIARDLLEEVAAAAGLTFAYTALPLEEEPEVDLSAGPHCAAWQGGEQTMPFLVYRCALVGREDSRGAAPVCVAVAAGVGQDAAEELCPGAVLMPMRGDEACLDAVLDGKCDAALLGECSLPYLTGNSRWDALKVLGLGSEEQHLCLRVPAGEDGARLVELLDKAIEGLDARAMGNAALWDARRRLRPARLANLVVRYRSQWIAACALLLAALALLFWGVRRYRGRLRALVERCGELARLCDNSQEGVLALRLTGERMEVLGGNARLREMAGLRAEEPLTPACFPERERLRSALERLEDGAYMEMDTLLDQRTGGPALVRLRASVQRNGGELCVYASVQDRTAERRALKERDLERLRSRLLLEQTGEAVFDIDVKGGGTFCSPQCRALFDEDGAERQAGDFISDLPFAPEDQGLYDEMLLKARAGASNLTARLRVRRRDGRTMWCDLRLSALTFEGETARIIGRLTNVEEQVSAMERRKMLALRDERTGLYTYTAFRYLVEQVLSKGEGLTDCALLLVEEDGSADGETQRAAAEGLRSLFRAQDHLARCGPGRYCVFVRNMPAEIVRAKAEAVLERLSAGGARVNAGVVRGLSGADFAGMMEVAQDALRQAQEKGAGHYEVAE